ncbi:MAG: NADH-quinone oxidoreductase subunit H [Deltaproteobacteria bacterium]|nr:NADH-quinone oxidoreductase subunit H [Deltaproteobacteria bacterium]
MILDLVLWTVIKFAAFVLVFVMGTATVLTWLERKYSAVIQNRIGPNRANLGSLRLGGLLHMLADPIKMLTKEDFSPDTANPWMFRLAPLVAFVPAMVVFAVIPFGPGEHMMIANTELGILFIFAIASLNVYGSVMGAWASNNKWSLMGGLRISAQMVSYEVAIGLTLCGVFMIYGSTDLQEIVVAQGTTLGGVVPAWGIFTQPVAFVLYLTCAIAENKRAPFDVAEAESELTAGYWTEYSAMGFAVLALAEFVEIVLIGCVGATLFLGGWQIPGVHGSTPGLMAVQVAAFLLKTLFVIWLQLTIRWTLPRFRYDQVMRLGWRILLPAALVNLLVTGVALLWVDRN